VKLLFDQNLSPRLVKLLSDVYPAASHVYLVHLDQATDVAVWKYAQQHGYAIVTRDVDFSELSMLRSFPPKIIWVRRGNCSTSDVGTLLRLQKDVIYALENDPDVGVIELS
jgi:predicted nuclease of predicted toxin-antitoxin system